MEADGRREDQWFLENEKKLLEGARIAREKRAKERAEEEAAEQRQRRKEQHWMKCPKCGHDMREEVLEGVAIDRCTFCEGLFFDADELERVFAKRAEERRSIFRRIVGI